MGSKNVIITGASRGIGKAIAEAFAIEGATLFLCARNKKVLDDTVAALQSTYPNNTIKAMVADLSKKEEAQQFGKWILSNVDSIDILINNAGQFLPGNIYNEEDNILEKLIETNFMKMAEVTASANLR
jgi:short-subunit dehydrogenase